MDYIFGTVDFVICKLYINKIYQNRYTGHTDTTYATKVAAGRAYARGVIGLSGGGKYVTLHFRGFSLVAAELSPARNLVLSLRVPVLHTAVLSSSYI